MNQRGGRRQENSISKPTGDYGIVTVATAASLRDAVFALEESDRAAKITPQGFLLSPCNIICGNSKGLRSFPEYIQWQNASET